MSQRPAIPPLGQVRVWSIDPPLSVLALLSEDKPNIDQGFGGWDEIERPRRKPLTTYKGAPGTHLTLPLLFDRFTARESQTLVAPGDSIEDELSQLMRMGQPHGADGQPPRLHVRARGAAIRFQGLTWVLNDLSWGDALVNAAGNRTRQQVTLSLIEYVVDVQLVERSAANRRRSKSKAKALVGYVGSGYTAGAKTKRITANRSATSKPKATQHDATSDPDYGQGEDLLTIAARELGDANRWIEIAKLNGLRDPRSIRPGQVLRLP